MFATLIPDSQRLLPSLESNLPRPFFRLAPSLPQVASSVSAHILAVVPAMVVGLISGLMAIAFTVLNLKVSRLRDELTSHLK